VLAQGRRHADQERVGLGDPVVVGGGLEPPPLLHRPDALRGDVADVALAAIEPLDLDRVDVEPKDPKPGGLEKLD